jgi:hypothetical protein
MPQKFFGRHVDCRLRKEKISMSEMQRQKSQAASIGLSDRNFKKKLTDRTRMV